MRLFGALITLFSLLGGVVAAQPLYFVGGERVEEISSIPQRNIKSITHLEPTEATIAEYGLEASDGVVIIELHRDQEAKFLGEGSFRDYLESVVEWPTTYAVAEVIMRFTINADGTTTAGEVLSSSDSRLKRRVAKAIDEAANWHPAEKDGEAIASEGVVRVLLPQGAKMPQEKYLIKR